MSDINEDCCVICREGFSEEEEFVTVTKKGLLTLISYSEKRNVLYLNSYLNERNSTTPIGKVLVHVKCRRDFTDQKRLNLCSNAEGPITKKLRSSLMPFSWNDNCLFCGKQAIVDTRHPEREQVYQVTTLPFRDQLLQRGKKRGDSCEAEVQHRLQGCMD